MTAPTGIAPDKGINLIGYFHGSFGLGESARLLVDSFKKGGIPYSLVSADQMTPHHQKEAFKADLSERLVHPINLFCIDPRHFFPFMGSHGWDCFKMRYNIALCFWETNRVPRSHRKPWSYLDEIWAPTRYVQEHLSIATSVPVYHISQPVELAYSPRRSIAEQKASFGLPNKFTFLFCFCFYSVLGRKNPLAIVEAFQKAFPNRHDVQVVIKSQNGESYPRKFRLMLESIKNDPRIIWIDQSLSSERRYDLMHACDCYVSLHRSEGFGLTMAETMLLGKPVIATGYSGNLDFMTQENSFLCPYRLVPIGRGHSPYSSRGIWADVDTRHAARWMESVVDEHKQALVKAEKGKKDVLNQLSCQTVGQQMAERLREIELRKVPRGTPWPYFKTRLIKTVQDSLPFLRPVARAARKTARDMMRKFR